MILVIGSSNDRVYPKLVRRLQASNCTHVIVDEDHATRYQLSRDECRGTATWRVLGDGCSGSRPVGSIFVRHAVARTLDPTVTGPMGELQTALNRMLLTAPCPVINHPSNAFSNYAKAYQTRLLAAAGFDVPKTLVTNIRAEALRFYDECGGKVIFKGASNVMSLAQVLKPQNMDRLNLLPNCPTQFQEFVAGVDYRVHVVGNDAFVTRLVSRDEDYRRAALIEDKAIVAEAAELPPSVIRRCIEFTKQLGLIVSGIDFKEDAQGRLAALELNPYPQFTFYEGRSGQPITETIVDYLVRHQAADSNVFV